MIVPVTEVARWYRRAMRQAQSPLQQEGINIFMREVVEYVVQEEGMSVGNVLENMSMHSDDT